MAAIVQTSANSTNANSPASITATYAATVAGNFLLLAVTVISDGSPVPSITTPAGWTLIGSSSGAIHITSLFIRANNPGGLTSTAVTISADNGGAACAFAEISGMSDSPTLEFSATGADAGSTAIPAIFSSPVPNVAELNFFAIGRQLASTITYSNSDVWSTPLQSASSTNGTSNTAIDLFICFNTGLVAPQTSGTLSGVVAFHSVAVRYRALASYPYVLTTVGGSRGLYVPQFNQGMIGG